jgi:hypothetical protein
LLEVPSPSQNDSGTFSQHMKCAKVRLFTKFRFTWLPWRLVATAVSAFFFLLLVVFCTHHMRHKLYATLYEWRTGEQQVMEFSANAYLDVYEGHVNTLKHIQGERENGFHLMMADIYACAE